MPTKRRVILFLIILSVMLLAKRMLGQDVGGSVGWDSQSGWECTPDEAMQYLLLAVVGGPICGVLAGACRVMKRNAAIRSGNLYQSEMVSLGLWRPVSARETT